RRDVLGVERRPDRTQQVDSHDQRADFRENLQPVRRFAREGFLRELDVRLEGHFLAFFSRSIAASRRRRASSSSTNITSTTFPTSVACVGGGSSVRRSGALGAAFFGASATGASCACVLRKNFE